MACYRWHVAQTTGRGVEDGRNGWRRSPLAVDLPYRLLTRAALKLRSSVLSLTHAVRKQRFLDRVRDVPWFAVFLCEKRVGLGIIAELLLLRIEVEHFTDTIGDFA